MGSAQLAGGGAGTVLCDAGFPRENLIFTRSRNPKTGSQTES